MYTRETKSNMHWTTKFAAWLITPGGRQAAYTGICVLGVGLFSVKYLPNTFFLNQYEEFVHLYRHGTFVSVPEKLKNMWNEVLNDMNMSDAEKSMLKPFMTCGFEMFHAGSLYTRQGGIVGLPAFFQYTGPNEVETDLMKVSGESVSWYSTAGENLKESLVISDKAKKFAMGREILYVSTPYLYYQSLFAPPLLILLYGAAYSVNRKYNLFARHRSIRYTIYGMLSVFGFGLWSLLHDSTNKYIQKKCDKAMSELGQTYIEGGVEFYSKTLQRNIALRTLMGSKGENLCSLNGNEKYLFRQKSVPLVNRKKYFEERLSASGYVQSESKEL